MLKSFLQKIVGADFIRCSLRCNDWSGEAVAELHPKSLLDVGCGDGSLLTRYLDYKPERYCGIEAAAPLRAKAEKRGIEVASCDLNGVWPYEDQSFDVVHSAQVIEHLHNTRLFIQEMFRVLKPGGTALVTSENLTSFLNLGAMSLGYTPFTLMRVCGWFTGNPLGLHYGKETEEHVDITDPAFAGVTGHIRALSVLQAKEIFDRVGFETDASSLGLMPLPDLVGKHLESLMSRRGHFLLIRARKPAPKKTRSAALCAPRQDAEPKGESMATQALSKSTSAAETKPAPKKRRAVSGKITAAKKNASVKKTTVKRPNKSVGKKAASRKKRG